MKLSALLLLFTFFVFSFAAQAADISAPPDSINSPRYRNGIYLEGLGNGLFYSVNYERLLRAPDNNADFAFRLGICYAPQGQTYILTAPAEVTFISGKRKVKFEAGAGLTFCKEIQTNSGGNLFSSESTRNEYILIPFFRLGARWQPENTPFYLRGGFTPLFLTDDIFFYPVLPSFALAVGYGF